MMVREGNRKNMALYIAKLGQGDRTVNRISSELQPNSRSKVYIGM